MNKEIENPLESIMNTIPFFCRDMSIDKRDAWIYGITCGWSYEAMLEVQKQHNWTDETVERLKRLHIKWIEICCDKEFSQ